jgi:intracellular septation protein A
MLKFSIALTKFSQPFGKTKLRGALAPVFLFALNLWICGRLLRAEYIDQLGSIEGVFIAMAGYIQRHWPRYDWFPFWWTGIPFPRVYQPALHYSVAVFSTVSGLSPASAYHCLIAITYSLGAVTFYLLVLATGGSRRTAFLSALVFSVFSPSTLLSSVIRTDVGGFLNPRRLQALVVYGEGPNVTGLTLAMLALAALHLAGKRRTALTGAVAALAIAAVPATSWPATMALAMGIAAYLLAQEFQYLKKNLLRLLAIGAGAWALASPFALPSTILVTLHATGAMADAPTPGRARWFAVILLVVTVFALRAALLKAGASAGLRFAALYSLITAWIVLAALWANTRILPYPVRFHLVMEIAFVLTGGLCLQILLRRRPGVQMPLTILLVCFCLFQARHYQRYSRGIIHTLTMENTVEYQEARWLASHTQGGRVMVPGSVSYWLNAFTEIPQMDGFFDQSLWNPINLPASYVVQAGYQNDRLSADYSLLWLKAYAVEAFGAGGDHSREFYRPFRFPDRFKGRFPLAWSSGDDAIYLIPERSRSLARVVPAASLVHDPPANGVDVAQLSVFVAALDNPALPLATFEWQDPNSAKIAGSLAPGQALEVAINYDRGWSATANGRAVDVRPDGLGFISLQPGCAGPCDVHLHWSPGSEPFLACGAAALALIVAGALILRERRLRNQAP